MGVTTTFILLLGLNIGIILSLTFAYSIIIHHHFKLNFVFSLSLGLLSFFGISYFLAYPFVLFDWNALFYRILLLGFYLGGVAYAFYLVIKKQAIQITNLQKNTFTLIIYCLIIGLFLFSLLRLTTGYEVFDSLFYIKHVVNNVDGNLLAWYSALEVQAINPLYDFSAYYYFHSFVIWLTKTIIPNVNVVYYGSLYIWQASFTYILLTVLTIHQVIKTLLKKSYLSVIVLFIIIMIFYNSLYFNTAFSFYGNSLRYILVADLFLYLQHYLKLKKPSLFDQALFAFLFAALIAVSSSGFYISAFFYYGFAYLLLKQDIDNPMKQLALIGIPIFLFLFQYILGIWTLVLTPLFAVIIYSLNGLFVRLRTKVLFLMTWIIPIAIIAVTFLFSSHFEFNYAYYFIDYGAADMYWPYATFQNIIFLLINMSFYLLLLCFAFMKETESNPYRVMILLLFFTFLNPLVIPFTIRFFTNHVYYRAFDLVFNPFVIGLCVLRLCDFLKTNILKKILPLIICLPFLIHIVTLQTTYWSKFLKPEEDYNQILKINNLEFDALTHLNQIIVNNNENYPLVASQIYQTISWIPAIKSPFSIHGMVESTGHYMTGEQIDLFNIMIKRVNSYENWIYGYEPEYFTLVAKIEDLKVDYVVIDKRVYFYTGNTTMTLQALMEEKYQPIYQNEVFAIYDTKQ